MSHANADLITRFYTAFQKRDHATMAACYHRDAVFGDPAFPRLEGARIGGMWRMLCTRAKDLDVSFRDVAADDRTGQAHWDAAYTFVATGRKVLNRIDARFEFKDGLIVRHDDDFDFKRWSRMALGLPGWLLGWTGWFRRTFQRRANDQLEKFLAKEAGGE